jgi:hypothetical protein
MARQYYSLRIEMSKDHRKKATFGLEHFHTIETKKQFDRVINSLRFATNLDKVGRVLCYGTPAYSIDSQKRMYVVKMGHDDILWQEVTASGQAIRQQLPEAKVRGAKI